MMNHAFSITNAMKDYESRLRDAQTFVNLLHGRNSAYVPLVHIENGGVKTTRSYNGNKIADAIADPCYDTRFSYDWIGQSDVYIALNAFNTLAKRTDASLSLLNALYTDLDFYKAPFNMTQAQARAGIERMIAAKEILTPSLIVNSGRGLQLIWLMDYMKNTPSYKKLWCRMQDAIADRFKHLNADSKARSTTQIYRLPGTHSSRNGARITFEHLYDRYSIAELKDFLLPKLDDSLQRSKAQQKPRSNKPRRKTTVKSNLTPYTLAMARKNDLETLVTIRGGNVNRKRLLHIYAVVALEVFRGDETRLEQALETLNERFNSPLPTYRITSAKASAHNSYCEKEETSKALYRYSNARIIDDLEITSDEQQYMTQLIDSVEKQRRNTESRRVKRREAGMKTMDEYNDQRAQKTAMQLETIQAMIEANSKVKNKVIAETLGVSVERVKQLKRQLKAQGAE